MESRFWRGRRALTRDSCVSSSACRLFANVQSVEIPSSRKQLATRECDDGERESLQTRLRSLSLSKTLVVMIIVVLRLLDCI